MQNKILFNDDFEIELLKHNIILDLNKSIRSYNIIKIFKILFKIKIN